MNQRDFKKLANIRIADAKVLLKTSRNASGAYYLAGYAVECAIKACIAKNTKVGDWPPKPDDVRKMYSHDLNELIKQANLAAALDTEIKTNPQFAGHWGIVKEWSEQKRYEQCKQIKASEMVVAITDNSNGVLAWIQQYW